MTLYRNPNVIQITGNTSYPDAVDVRTDINFEAVIRVDHILSHMKGNSRKVAGTEFSSAKQRFIESDVLFGDIDNDWTEMPEEWVTQDAIESALSGIEYWLTTSKSHMKEKSGRAARPKWHLYFPIPTITAYQEYELALTALRAHFCTFNLDPACSDCSRHVSGVGDAVGPIYHHSGNSVLNTLCEDMDFILEARRLEEAERSRPAFLRLGASIDPNKDTPFSLSRFAGLGPGEEGHRKLYSAVCSMFARGYDDAVITSTIQRLNAAMMTPRPVQELSSMIKGVLRHPRPSQGRPVSSGKGYMVDLMSRE